MTRSSGTRRRSSSTRRTSTSARTSGSATTTPTSPTAPSQQFDESLKIDPKHAKTLLNMGIVRAFGKQDLAGAEQAWQQVVQLAPNSPEGQAAKRALDSLKSAHPGRARPGPKSGA